MKIKTLAAIFVTITACGKASSFEKSTDSTSLKDPTSGINTEFSVCYSDHCFNTISIDSISEAKKDYVYPDPADEIDRDLLPFYRMPYAVLDLTLMRGDQHITDNFIFEDYMSIEKGQYGIFSPIVVEHMQSMRDFMNRPITINSGYRNPGYNSRVPGSAKWSRHTYGDAVDFTVSGKQISELAALCKKYGASFTKLYESHIHCDWRTTPADSGFYPPLFVPEQMSAESLAHSISAKSSILLTTIDGEKVLSTLIPLEYEEEDEGVPLYEWQIQWGDGQIQTSDQPRVVLQNKKSGSIKVRVVIGGSIQLEQNFKW